MPSSHLPRVPRPPASGPLPPRLRVSASPRPRVILPPASGRLPPRPRVLPGVLAAAILILTILTAHRSASAQAPAGLVVPIEGQPYQASLVAAQADGMLTFDREGSQHRLAATELVTWSSPADARGGSRLMLADGSLLMGDVLTLADDGLVVDTLSAGQLTLPLDQVAGILFQPPGGQARRDKLVLRLALPPPELSKEPPAEGLALPPARPGADLVLLDNGDELTGTVNQLQEELLHFQGPVGAVTIQRPRVIAIAFNPRLLSRPRDVALDRDPPGESPAAGNASFAIIVGCRDGSRLSASHLVIDSQRALVRLPAGIELSLLPADIVFLQPLGGRAVYLSDLRALGYRHLPYLDLAWPYHLDAAVSGGRLRAAGRLYLKGIGMHSASRLTYPLDGAYTRFDAQIAIDDAAGGMGSVTFKVYVDEQQRYASPIIRGGQPPQPISIDVTGGRRLSLLIDFADRADVLDYADWLNPRLIPRPHPAR